MAIYDYVIVGAGSAGAPLAARLSEDGVTRVLLLEAGPTARHPWLKIPIAYGKTFFDERFNWKYATAPEPALNGRSMYWPRGKTLGGSSSINAMVYVRGHPADYAAWGAAAPGWDWAAVAPVFQKMEDWRGAPDPARGVGGPLTVRDPTAEAHPLTHAYLAAAAAAGVPVNPDYNAGAMEGAAIYQITVRDGLRASTASAYLAPAAGRANLTVRTGAQATRILFDGRRAAGIEHRIGAETLRAEARREVILCAGAIDTPKLLQLSGIGPGALLQDLGIETLVDAPAVGAGLIDHLGVDFVYLANRPSLNQSLRPLWSKAWAALRYLATRSGPLALSLNQGGGFVRLGPGDGPPDLQLYFSPLSYERAPAGVRPLMSPDPFPGFRFGFNPCKPTSRGAVRIRTPDPAAAPEMRGGYLSTEADRRMMIEGCRLIRRIAAARPLAEVIAREITPGPATTSDEALLALARNDSWTVFHQCGTCRMGTDPAADVVDPRLRVFGVEGLRVADASIFPEIPSGNTNAPAIMVGERAAEIIREDAGKRT